MNGAARAKLLFCLLDQDVFVAVAALDVALDCKTVRMFAYSSTRQQPNGRVTLAQFARVRLLRHALPISLLFCSLSPLSITRFYVLFE